MKKVFALVLALVTLLSLTACKKKEAEQPPAPSAPAEQPEEPSAPPVLKNAEDVTVEAEVEEGRAPGGEYTLPEELTPMTQWLQNGAVALLARQEDVRFYGVEGKELSPALLRWEDSMAEFDWWYSTPHAIEPELWVYDIDGDGETEVVANCYAASGTGVSLEYLYIVEKDAEGALTSYHLPWQELCEQVDDQLQTISMNDGTYAALGRELLDITADVSAFNAEDLAVCMGQVARYKRGEEGLECAFGVVAEGKGIAHLSTYVGVIEGTLHYEDGVFALKDLHLRSN